MPRVEAPRIGVRQRRRLHGGDGRVAHPVGDRADADMDLLGGLERQCRAREAREHEIVLGEPEVGEARALHLPAQVDEFLGRRVAEDEDPHRAGGGGHRHSPSRVWLVPYRRAAARSDRHRALDQDTQQAARVVALVRRGPVHGAAVVPDHDVVSAARRGRGRTRAGSRARSVRRGGSRRPRAACRGPGRYGWGSGRAPCGPSPDGCAPGDASPAASAPSPPRSAPPPASGCALTDRCGWRGARRCAPWSRRAARRRPRACW